MAHGGPDWGGSTPTDYTHPISDIGELAARLNSIDRFDRRGNVVFLDSFEEGLAHIQYQTYGGNSFVELRRNITRTGQWAAYLFDDVAGLGQIQLFHSLGICNATRIGVEVSLTVSANTWYVRWSFDYYSGANFYAFNVRYDHVNSLLAYYNNAGGFTTFATGVTLRTVDVTWHTGKLVANLITHKYVRFILNEVEYDLANIDCYSGASAQTPHLVPGLAPERQVGVSADWYVDDWIVTINEP